VQAGDGRPSYDELAALVVRQAAVIEQLQADVAALRAENAELKRRLGMNSTNSSKPPSSDSPFVKPAPKSLRGKSKRKPGGQAGHPGSTLSLVVDPNERVRHEPGPCTGPYSFRLTPAGRANPYEALVRLFDPQPPHRRTLIHCDYLISVIQFRVFAESITAAEFNRRVAAGTTPMVLWAHGFSDISHVPNRRTGTEPGPEATSLQEVYPPTEADLVIGDHVQFWNHPAYDLLIGDDGGVWRMENVILVGRRSGQDEFEGHGSGRLTALGMRQRLAAAFNAQVDEVLAAVARLRRLRIGSSAHTAQLTLLARHHIDQTRSGQPARLVVAPIRTQRPGPPRMFFCGHTCRQTRNARGLCILASLARQGPSTRERPSCPKAPALTPRTYAGAARRRRRCGCSPTRSRGTAGAIGGPRPPRSALRAPGW
jgi:hypothetical protein